MTTLPRLIGTAAGLALLASAAGARADDFDWRAYEGQSIYGLVFNAPYTDAYIKPQLGKFEELTGIKVRLEAQVDTQARKKLDIMMAGHNSSLDFYTLQMDNNGGSSTVGGYLENLEPYIADPRLTPTGYDYPGDWAGGCLNTVKVLNGQPVNNLVFSAQAQLLHVRTDLFEEQHLALPTTMAELEDAARKLTLRDADGAVETYGFLARGWGSNTTASFGTYLYNFGGSWFRDEGDKRVSNLNSKEAIDALEYYGRMLRDYGPASALDNRPDANAALFAAGKIAMLSELNYYIYDFENPNSSRVAGKVATILVPSGAGGSYPNLPTTSFAISPFSKKKEAAWLLIAWLTSREQMLVGQKAGVPTCRSSVWNDPSYAPPTASWGKSASIALDYGIAIAKPQAIAINEIRDAAAEIIGVAIRDGSRQAIEAEASKQVAVINELVARTEQGRDFQGVFRGEPRPVPAEVQRQPVEAVTASSQ